MKKLGLLLNRLHHRYILPGGMMCTENRQWGTCTGFHCEICSNNILISNLLTEDDASYLHPRVTLCSGTQWLSFGLAVWLWFCLCHTLALKLTSCTKCQSLSFLFSRDDNCFINLVMNCWEWRGSIQRTLYHNICNMIRDFYYIPTGYMVP